MQFFISNKQQALTWLVVLVLLLIVTSPKLMAQNCNCEEYIYLNEMTVSVGVHKFLVNSNGSLTEIGSPWYNNSASGESLNNPHGLGTDLNGFLYIGETNNGDIRRLTCEGDIIPAVDYEIDDGGMNFGSIGNTLLINPLRNDATDGIYAYDLCTTEQLGYICLEDPPVGLGQDWGFHVDKATNEVYATHSAFNQNNTDIKVYRFDFDEIVLNGAGNPTDDCIAPLMVPGATATPAVGTNTTPFGGGNLQGITTDTNGNIYIVEINNNRVLKYNNAGQFIAASVSDNTEDGSGYFYALGIVYSETSDRLYVSTLSTVDDCIAMFDTNLNYLGAAVPSPGTGSLVKGIGILKECCPISATQTIDQTYCTQSVGKKIFLNEIFPCNGTICGGTWDPDPNNTGITYDPCDQSVTLSSASSCASFTKSGSNAQCGAFTLNYNVELLSAANVFLSFDQMLCIEEEDTPATMTATTTDNIVHWEQSTTACADEDSFTMIPGTEGATSYSPGPISEDTYYRVIVEMNGLCSTGSCNAASNCIAVTFDCSPPSCDSPVATAEAFSASCNEGGSNNDGSLQITTASDATHYSYVMGSDYSTGNPNINNATAFDSTTDLPLQFGTLSNPTGTQDYTIRLFNGLSTCFTDVTVVLNEEDCQIVCPPMQCIPIQIMKN